MRGYHIRQLVAKDSQWSNVASVRHLNKATPGRSLTLLDFRTRIVSRLPEATKKRHIKAQIAGDRWMNMIAKANSWAQNLSLYLTLGNRLTIRCGLLDQEKPSEQKWLPCYSVLRSVRHPSAYSSPIRWTTNHNLPLWSLYGAQLGCYIVQLIRLIVPICCYKPHSPPPFLPPKLDFSFSDDGAD
jgi:hypothetical protein